MAAGSTLEARSSNHLLGFRFEPLWAPRAWSTPAVYRRGGG